MNKAQQKGSELYNRMSQEGKDAVNRGQAALREIRDNTLISTIVRYSLLVESTMLTLFGLVHFFMPAYAAQFTFPSSKHVHFSDTHSTSGSKSLNRKKLSTIPIDTNQSFINDQTDQNNSTNITNSTHSERVDNKQSSHSVPRSIPHTTITAATTAKSIASPVIAPSISVTPDEAIVSSKALRARKNNPRLDKFNGDEDDIPVLSNKILTVQQQPVVEFVSKHEQATNNGTKKKKKHRYQH